MSFPSVDDIVCHICKVYFSFFVISIFFFSKIFILKNFKPEYSGVDSLAVNILLQLIVFFLLHCQSELSPSNPFSFFLSNFTFSNMLIKYKTKLIIVRIVFSCM